MFVSLKGVVAAVALLVLIVPIGAFAQTATRVSVGLSGVESNANSLNPKISADGRFVVYRSFANNLVANDTNNEVDLFQTELATGITKRINVASDGSQTTGLIAGYAVSANGRYVAFSSNAPGLVPSDTNVFSDIFVRDMVNNTTSRISNGLLGLDVDGDSIVPSISADGRYIAYESPASNLILGDANGVRDVFLYDTNTGVTTQLSRSTIGIRSNGRSYNAMISSDGSRVAFYSEGTNLVSGDTNGVGDVFVRTIATNTTEVVSVSTTGTRGNGVSGTEDISLSGDGKLIAFDSAATNLVTGDTNARMDVFVRDITAPAAPTTTRVSVSTAGVQSDGLSFLNSITSDGKYVLFDSNATNLVTGDTNATFDVFLFNRSIGTTARVSLGSGNVEGNNESSFADISADGNKVVFASFATNLVSNDTNLSIDVFMRTVTPSGASLTGTLNLEGIAQASPNQTLTFTFRNGGVDTMKTVSVSPSGAFTITDLLPADYTVLVSGGSYLSKRINVNLSAGNVTLSDPILLKSGDVNRDNAVDVADLLAVINVYNKKSTDSGYLPAADFNLDGANAVEDLLLVIANYNQIGDSL